MSTQDYLYEDPVISNQKFACISILTPKNFKQDAENPITMNTLKVRGCYETYEEAKKRADFLRNIDPNINVYVGEVGKWLPFEDDPEKAKEHDYQNKRLNEMMKGYLENQEKAKEFHEQRKNEMIMKSLKENEAKDQRNKARQARRDAGEVVDDEAEEKEFLAKNSVAEVANINVEKKTNKKQELIEKENEIKEKETDVKQNKDDLQKTREEYNIYQKKNDKIKRELEDARRVFDDMMAASKSGNASSGKVQTQGVRL